MRSDDSGAGTMHAAAKATAAKATDALGIDPMHVSTSKNGGIDTILFDFDGTIMDTNDVIIQSWQHTFRTFRGEEGDEDKILETFGETLEYTMKNLFPEVALEEGLAVYRGYQRENFLSSIKMVPGMRDVLDELLERGYLMAMVTSRLRYTTEQAMEEFDLGKYFRHVVTADDVTRAKPDPQCVEMALETLNSSADRAIMTGDTVHDIQCARNGGVISVLAGWSITLGGMDRSDFPEDEAPDHIITHPSQLLDLIHARP